MFKRIKWTTFLIGMAAILLLCATGCGQPGKENATDPVFQKLDPAVSGIAFENRVDENYSRNYFDTFAYVYNGAGVATADFNNDGLVDVFFAGNEVGNRLFVNKGNLKFEDITEKAGVHGGKGWNNGVAVVDINGDGLNDIYVTRGGFRDPESARRNLLFVNRGDLGFTEEAAAYGLDDAGYSIHAVFFDMDNDNDLDMYLTNRPDSFYLGLSRMVSGKRNPPDACRDKLFRNDGKRFTEIGRQAGIRHNFGYALSVLAADLNNDSFQDIFVGNDYADNDYFYINQGDGTFRDEVKKMTNHLSLFSMGADIADLNNDGLEDILVMEMLPENYKRSKVSMPRMDVEGFWAIVDSGFQKQYMHNALHLNQGNGFFSEVSQLAGVTKTEWSWSTLASDFDNDGRRDIFVANGYRRDLFDGDIAHKQDMYVRANMHKYGSAEEMFEEGFKEYIEIYDPIRTRNYLFRNKGELQFENVSEAWGFRDSTFSNGAAVADLDNDGDLDLVINNLDGPADLYENISNREKHYLRLRLQGPNGNPDGIGAKITLYQGGKPSQFFQQKTVRGYLSSNEPIVHFGLGEATMVDSLLLLWPDGKYQVMNQVKADQVLAIDYTNASQGRDFMPRYTPMLQEQSGSLMSEAFVHRENKYNEYADQVLLPHEFSRSGPFIATGDINGDGLQDYYVGGAKGQAGALHLQVNGRFEKIKSEVLEADRGYEDMGCLFFDADGDADLDLYVVSGGSEFPEGSAQYQDRLYLNDGKAGFTKASLPVTISSGSVVLAFDFDGDGDLDIFRGGEVVPHAYPYSPVSYLLQNEGGRFVNKTRELAPDLEKIGMVKTALWADLDGDKKGELLVAGEWMPLQVFSFASGKARDVSAKFGLEKTEGWWNRVVAHDIDGDGDPDLVAGNLGENYKFQASTKKPFEVYAGDIDGNGSNDIFLAKHLNEKMVPIRGRECTSQQCPMIAQKFPTYLSFAESDLQGILGKETLEKTLHRKAHLFSTVVWENRDGKFVVHRLPMEAQLSTVNGIMVQDFDGDGIKDILLAGNKFDVEVETTAADASPGVLLRGQGNFLFSALKPLQSGFFVPYNVKDLQTLPLPDGQAILVSANNDSLRIFKTLPSR